MQTSYQLLQGNQYFSIRIGCRDVAFKTKPNQRVQQTGQKFYSQRLVMVSIQEQDNMAIEKTRLESNESGKMFDNFYVLNPDRRVECELKNSCHQH